MPISTRNLTNLPDVDRLRRLLQSLAVLDAVLCSDWEDRYYSFDTGWAPGEMVGSMRNGSGDGFFALFNDHGCFFKGFAHEAPMSPNRNDPPMPWPGLFEGLPPGFEQCLKEPAFDIDDTTFCIWRANEGAAWQTGNIQFPDDQDPDGSEQLLSPLDCNPETYGTWAKDYYGEDWPADFTMPLAAVQAIYEHEPLTGKLVKSLNPEVSVEDISEDAHEIGYPTPP